MTFLFTTLLLAVFTSLVSAQYNVTGFGEVSTQDKYWLDIYRADRRPLHTNRVAFQGFNMTIPISSSTAAGGTLSSETWYLQLNSTSVVVPPSNNTIARTVMGLEFPGGRLPFGNGTNGTDWQICASIVMDKLPASLANIRGNNSDGSCVPYLGQECVDAYLAAYRRNQATAVAGCRAGPLLTTIDACKSRINTNDEGVATTVISNTTDPNIVRYFSNDSYVDIRTWQNVSNPTFQGLSSGQPFVYQNRVFSNSSAAAGVATEGRQIELVGLAIVPSVQFRDNNRGGYGYSPDVRMICGRADTTTPASNAAPFVKGSSFAALITAIAVSVLGSML